MLNRQDWDLHRKGAKDTRRHNEKIRDAIKNNLQEMISEENIITKDGKRTVKVPVRGIKEFHFRYGDFQGIGSGKGDSEEGEVLHRQPRRGEGQDGGDEDGDHGGGNTAGEEIYEVEITIDELAELVFEDLELPNLDQKKQSLVKHKGIEYRDIRKQGVMPNLDKRRTLKANIKRHAVKGRAQVGRFQPEDLRFRTWEESSRSTTNAVIIAMRDCSASMGEFEKYVSRSFFFWMLRFLRTQYDQVDVVFIIHHTEARTVGEEDFFQAGASGGTRCSAAYNLALEIIHERYPPSQYNLYPFHFSDGDNWPQDNEPAIQSMKQLLDVSNAVGYGEIQRSIHLTKLSRRFEQAFREHPRYSHVIIQEKSDVWDALKAFFSRGEDTAERSG